MGATTSVLIGEGGGSGGGGSMPAGYPGGNASLNLTPSDVLHVGDKFRLLHYTADGVGKWAKAEFVGFSKAAQQHLGSVFDFYNVTYEGKPVPPGAHLSPGSIGQLHAEEGYSVQVGPNTSDKRYLFQMTGIPAHKHDVQFKALATGEYLTWGSDPRWTIHISENAVESDEARLAAAVALLPQLQKTEADLRQAAIKQKAEYEKAMSDLTTRYNREKQTLADSFDPAVEKRANVVTQAARDTLQRNYDAMASALRAGLKTKETELANRYKALTDEDKAFATTRSPAYIAKEAELVSKHAEMAVTDKAAADAWLTAHLSDLDGLTDLKADLTKTYEQQKADLVKDATMKMWGALVAGLIGGAVLLGK
jgi:hypothetical protein